MLVLYQTMALSHHWIYMAQSMHHFTCTRAKNNPIPYSMQMLQKKAGAKTQSLELFQIS